MENLLRNVSDLPASARSSVEQLFGHPLRDDQRIYIAAIDAQATPVTEARQLAWNETQQIIGEMQRNVERSGVLDDELDEIIDRECQAVRHGDK